MKTFIFAGELSEQLGESINLEISSMREFWNALFALNPRFEKYFIDKCLLGTEYFLIDEAGVKFESFCMDVVLPKDKYTVVPQFQAAAGIPGMGMLGAFAGNAAMGWAMQKLTDKLTPKEETGGVEEFEIIETNSHLYSKNENKAEQGTPIPVVYGQLRVGSLVVNSNISNYDFDYKTAKIRRLDDVLDLPNVESFNFLREGFDFNKKYNYRHSDKQTIEPIADQPSTDDSSKYSVSIPSNATAAKNFTADQGNDAYNSSYEKGQSAHGGFQQTFGPGQTLTPRRNDSSFAQNPGLKPAVFPPRGNKDANFRPLNYTDSSFIYDGKSIGAQVGTRGKYLKLESIAIYRSLDLICEGPIAGFALPISEPSKYSITEGIGFFSDDHGKVTLPLIANYDNTITTSDTAIFSDIKYDLTSNHLRDVNTGGTQVSFETESVIDEDGFEKELLVRGKNYPANLRNYTITANQPTDSRGFRISLPPAVLSESAQGGSTSFGTLAPYRYNHIWDYNQQVDLTDSFWFSIYCQGSTLFDVQLANFWEHINPYRGSLAFISTNSLFSLNIHDWKPTFLKDKDERLGASDISPALDGGDMPNHRYIWGNNQAKTYSRPTYSNVLVNNRLGFNCFWLASNDGNTIQGDSETTDLSDSLSTRDYFQTQETHDLPNDVFERLMFSDLSTNEEYRTNAGLGFQDLKSTTTNITIKPQSEAARIDINPTSSTNQSRFTQARAFDYFSVIPAASQIGFSPALISDDDIIAGLDTTDPEAKAGEIPYLKGKFFKNLIRIYADTKNPLNDTQYNKSLRFYLGTFGYRTATIQKTELLSKTACNGVNGSWARLPSSNCSWHGATRKCPCTYSFTQTFFRYYYVDITFSQYASLSTVSVKRSGEVAGNAGVQGGDASGATLPQPTANSNPLMYSFSYKTNSNKYVDYFRSAVDSGSAKLAHLLRNETFSKRVYDAFKNHTGHTIPSTALPTSTSIFSGGSSNHNPIFLKYVPGSGSAKDSNIVNFLQNPSEPSCRYMYDATNPCENIAKVDRSSIFFAGGSTSFGAQESNLNKGYYVPDIVYRVEVLVLRKHKSNGSISQFMMAPTTIEAFASINSSGKVAMITVAKTPDLPVYDSMIGGFTPILPTHTDTALPFTTATAQTGAFERYYQDIGIVFKIDASNNGLQTTITMSGGKLVENKLYGTGLTNSNYKKYVEEQHLNISSSFSVRPGSLGNGILPDNMNVNDSSNDAAASFELEHIDFTLNASQGGATISAEKPPSVKAVIGMKCEVVDLSSNDYDRVSSLGSTPIYDEYYDDPAQGCVPGRTYTANYVYLRNRTFVRPGDKIFFMGQPGIGEFTTVSSYNAETGRVILTKHYAWTTSVHKNLSIVPFVRQARIERQVFGARSKFFTGRVTSLFLKNTGSNYRTTDGASASLNSSIFLFNRYMCTGLQVMLNSVNGANKGYRPSFEEQDALERSFTVVGSLGGLAGLSADPARDLSLVIQCTTNEYGEIAQALVLDPGYTNKKTFNKIYLPLNQKSFNKIKKHNSFFSRYTYSTRDYAIAGNTHYIDPDEHLFKQDLKLRIPGNAISQDGSIQYIDLIQYGFGFNTNFVQDDFLEAANNSSGSSNPRFKISTDSKGSVTSLTIDTSGPVGSYSEADNPITISLSPPASSSVDIPVNDPVTDQYGWARSIYLNGTPMRDKDGLFNFSKFHFDIKGGYYKNGNPNSSYFATRDIHSSYRSPLLAQEFRLPAHTHIVNHPLYGPRDQNSKDFYYLHTVENPEISMVSLSIKVNELHYVYEGDESVSYLNLKPTVYAIIAYIIAQKILDQIVNIAIPDPQVDINNSMGASFPCGGPVSSVGSGVGLNPPVLSGTAEIAATEIVKSFIVNAASLMAALATFAAARKFPCNSGLMKFLCIKMGEIIKNSGEIWPAKLMFRLEYGIEGEPFKSKDFTIQGCATSPFVKDIFIPEFASLDPKSGNNYRNRLIKVYRLTREMDPLTGGIIEARYKMDAELFSVNEYVAGYFSYPNSAMIGIRVNSKDMPDIPRREYLIKGKLVKIPTGYKPQLGAYDSTWDGLFEENLQWTSNPAWIIYDLLWNPVYGMGKYGLTEDDIDKWSFWKFSKRCDEPVTVALEGITTKERRYMCNVYINSQKPAYDLIKELLNLYGATVNFSGGKVYISYDSPGDDNDAGGSIMLFNNSNVTEAGFSYATTPQTSRITACTVDYLDERDGYIMKSEYYEDIEGIKEHGYSAIKIAGIAITRKGEANRLAMSKVHSRQLEKEVINFSTSLQGSYLRIGDIIEVADNNKMSHQCGGRIMKVDENNRKKIYIDIPVKALPPEINTFYIQDIRDSFTPDTDSDEEPEHTKQYSSFQVLEREGFVLTLDKAVSSNVRGGFVWLVKQGKDDQDSNIGGKQFKVKSIKEVKSGSEYEIMALEHSKIKYEIIDGGATVELDDAEYNEHQVVPTDTFTDVL